MIYVITNLARIFCCVLFYLSIVTLEWLTVTLQGAHRRRNHVVSKSKNKQEHLDPILFTPYIEEEGSSFSSWATLTFKSPSNFLRCQSIRRMLAHLSNVVQSWNTCSSYLSPSPKKNSFWFLSCTKKHIQIFSLWNVCNVQTLHPDDRDTFPRFLES